MCGKLHNGRLSGVRDTSRKCGLKWSGDGGPQAATLASGGNDNKVCIWDLRGSRRATVGGRSGAGSGGGGGNTSGSAGEDGVGGDAPLWKFHEHTAAVKALAWDPHVSGVLATGGGTQDKHIRFWNVLNGSMLSELDTGSQVCYFPSFVLKKDLMLIVTS
jgi:cell division cycle 20-like protein 1 (cofactor of APC complex)